MRVAVVGSGVSGGILAQGLREIPGLDVVVIEQVDRDDHANAGNGLNVGPNAMRALDAVLPDLGAALRANSLPWTRWMGHLVSGEPLFHTPLADVADRPGIRIRWSDLYRIARSGGPTLYGHEFIDLAPPVPDRPLSLRLKPQDAPTLQLDDIDLIVASDGRFSKVRALISGEPPVRHLGIANFRVLIDDEGRSGIDDLAEFYHGPNRLLTFRLRDGRVYLSGNLPLTPGDDIADARKTADALRTAFLPAHGPVLDTCRMLVDAACLEAATLHWSRSQEIPTQFHDESGRVLFLGDAAHAMAPTLGQGATQAIEDACWFVALVRAAHARGQLNPVGLTAAFAAARRDRIEFVKSLSWEASRPLLLDADPVRDTAEKRGAPFRANLRRLYCDGDPCGATFAL